MATAKEVRELTAEELDSRLIETKQELFNLRFQSVTGQLDNVARLGQLRKDIARMNTIEREREIVAAENAEAAENAPSNRRKANNGETN